MIFFRRLAWFWFVQVLGRALDDAFRFGRIHLVGIGFTLASTVLASVIYTYFRGPDAGYDKIVWFALYTLCNLASVLALGFSWYFVRTPLLLSDEARAKTLEAEGKLAAVTSELAAHKQNHELEKAKLAEEVKAAKKPDPATSIKLDKLKRIIVDYQAVIVMCDNSQNDAIERFYTVDGRGENFVRQECGDIDRFNGQFPFTNTHTSKIRYDKSDFEQYKTKCDQRLQYLQSLLSHYE